MFREYNDADESWKMQRAFLGFNYTNHYFWQSSWNNTKKENSLLTYFLNTDLYIKCIKYTALLLKEK